jgi:CheY-like chemotaxis protein
VTTPIAPSPRPRILVVDDVDAIRAALARSLRHWFSAATAPNARAALKLLSQETFDAILTDFEMPPGPDGVWLLDATRRLHPTVRRFLGTAHPLWQFDEHVSSGLIEVCFRKPIAAASFFTTFNR